MTMNDQRAMVSRRVEKLISNPQKVVFGLLTQSDTWTNASMRKTQIFNLIQYGKLCEPLCVRCRNSGAGVCVA